jgi:hypothetical protein
MKRYFKLCYYGLVMIIPVILAGVPPDTLWTRTYGGAANDIGYSICPCLTGGYLIVGYISSVGSGPQSAYVVKIQENGNTEWTRVYGGASWDGAHYVHPTADTCYIIAGYTESFGAGGKDMYLLKLDQNGDTVWTRTYGMTLQDCAYVVCDAYDTGYLVAGYKNGPAGWIKGDLWLLKIDEDGDTLWTRTYGGTGEDYGTSLHHTLDNNYIISGINSYQSAGGKDAWLLKIDQDGDTIWTKVYGAGLEDVSYGVNITSDSGYIMTGYKNGTGSWTPGDLWLIRTDANGDSIWSREYGGTGEDFGFDVFETPDHGFIIAGETCFGAGMIDVWLVRTDADGDTCWTQTYGGASNDASLGLCLDDNGGYVIAGHTSSFGSGTADVYVIRTDTDTGVRSEQGSLLYPVVNTSTIVKGPLTLPVDKSCRVYSGLGARLDIKQLTVPGVYFIQYDELAIEKIILIK